MGDKNTTSVGVAAATMGIERSAGRGGGDEEMNGSKGMRTVESLLRLLPMGLCLMALVLMLKNSQSNDFGSLSYSDLGAFRYIICYNDMLYLFRDSGK